MNRFLILIAFLLVEAWSLNPLHNAQYSFYPQPFRKNTAQVQVGARSSMEKGDIDLPIALVYGLGESFEFGFKYEFSSRGQDFDKDRLENTLDLGLRAAISKIETIQMDVQIGLGKGAGNGAILGYDIYHALTKAFQVIYGIKGSFFEAHNGPKELALVEVGLYPRIRFADSFHIISGLSYSTSITSPVDYSAFDITPGFELRLSSGTKVQFLVDMGVAGVAQEQEFLYNLGVKHDF